MAGLENCTAIVAAIDDRGAEHLAATCGSTITQIRYAVSTDGQTWKTTPLKVPTGRLELDPQLAFVGDTLYLAYTRVAPTDGGCGDNGLQDVGVYYRTRTLPRGAWSEPTRIGAVADHLQSLRVNGSVIHATVTNEKDGSTAYETVTGGTTIRIRIGDATGWTSLRIGDDGKGRIAYESAKGIAFATVDGGKPSSTTIPGSTNGWDPMLALAPGNAAYVLWNRSYHGAGCVSPDPDPADGTWFATNASGSWVSSRLTPQVGAASLTIDPATGDVHALVVGRGLIGFDRTAGGVWTHGTILSGDVWTGAIRQNPTTGALFVACVVGSDSADPAVEVMTRS